MYAANIGIWNTQKESIIMETTRTTTHSLTRIALMTAVLCIISPFTIPLPFSPVPLSLATFGLYLSCYVLGMKNSAISCILYILIGIAGIPVFSSFGSGIGKIAGPTGGYLIGYLFLVVIGGFFVEHFSDTLSLQIGGILAGTAVCYLFGTVWLAVQLHVNFTAALMIGVVPYLIGDALKIAAAVFIGRKLKSALQFL